MDSIQELVRKAESDYKSGQTQISEYVAFDLKANIDKIDAYLNSKHISGDIDSMGREKPFFNIVIAAANIWFRATDIDRKNIRIKAAKAEQYLLAFLASIHLQEWMKRSAFGAFLNEWGRVLGRYGSAVLKFIEKSGELSSEVIPWNRLIVDAVDFDANPKIEKLYFTPAQLRMNKSYDQELVEALIDAQTPRKTLGDLQKDNKSDYIEVYEVHGELPLYYLTDEKDDQDTYQQQMQVVSFVAKKDKGKFDDYTLYAGREARDPYLITHLIKEDGRSQAIGAVEHLFEAQWMKNHNVKTIKDQLDLASLILLQTSDGNFVGLNVLTNMMQGDILIHADNQPLTQLNNKADIAALTAFGQQWEVLAKEITSTPEAIRGETMPSGTPYSLGAYLGGQAGSLFEIMTENKGLYIEEMMRKFILPHLKKKMDTAEEIGTTLESHQIKQIDSAFVPKEAIRMANEQIKTDILSGKATQQPDLKAIESQIQGKLNEFGNQRFIRPSEIKTTKWKDIFKDFLWTVEVEVTAEQQDKAATMQTLSTVLQTLATNPNVLQDPNMRLLFNRILETAGSFSAIELAQTPPPPIPQQIPQPQSISPALVGAGINK